MSKSLAGKRTQRRRDTALHQFVTRDIGDDIRKAGTARLVRPQRATSILMPSDLLAALKVKAEKKGIPYQTLMKMIVREHLDEY
jgi:predicted DNA binding CopG/RHH family protein